MTLERSRHAVMNMFVTACLFAPTPVIVYYQSRQFDRLRAASDKQVEALNLIIAQRDRAERNFAAGFNRAVKRRDWLDREIGLAVGIPEARIKEILTTDPPKAASPPLVPPPPPPPKLGPLP